MSPKTKEEARELIMVPTALLMLLEEIASNYHAFGEAVIRQACRDAATFIERASQEEGSSSPDVSSASPTLADARTVPDCPFCYGTGNMNASGPARPRKPGEPLRFGYATCLHCGGTGKRDLAKDAAENERVFKMVQEAYDRSHARMMDLETCTTFPLPDGIYVNGKRVADVPDACKNTTVVPDASASEHRAKRDEP